MSTHTFTRFAPRKVTRTTNQDCRAYVKRKQDFKGSNLFGRTIQSVSFTYDDDSDRPSGHKFSDEMFAVYSYGEHFPLYVYVFELDKWFGNNEKYSVTTSKHTSQSHPHCEVTYMSCANLKNLISRGWRWYYGEILKGNRS